MTTALNCSVIGPLPTPTPGVLGKVKPPNVFSQFINMRLGPVCELPRFCAEVMNVLKLRDFAVTVCARGAAPPQDFLAVCLLRAILLFLFFLSGFFFLSSRKMGNNKTGGERKRGKRRFGGLGG